MQVFPFVLFSPSLSLAQRLIQIIKKIRSGVTVPVCLPSENRIHLGNPDGFPQFVCLVFGRQSTAFSSSGWAFVFAQSVEDFNRATAHTFTGIIAGNEQTHTCCWSVAIVQLCKTQHRIVFTLHSGAAEIDLFCKPVNAAKRACILYSYWGFAVNIHLADSSIRFTRELIRI